LSVWPKPDAATYNITLSPLIYPSDLLVAGRPFVGARERILCLFKDKDRISMFSVIKIDRELPAPFQVVGKG
jgi:hypothetical protein